MKFFMAALLATCVVAIGVMPASANDARIAEQIIGQLRGQQEAARLQGFNIGVQVEQGTVTMMGEVASAEQWFPRRRQPAIREVETMKRAARQEPRE